MLEVCGDEEAAHDFLAQNGLIRTVAPGIYIVLLIDDF